MIPANPTLTIPLAEDADGVLRVGGSRVSFDAVYEAYVEGLTVEEIAQRYPTVSLTDLYAVIGYTLNHLDLIEPYLNRRKAEAAAVRLMNEGQNNPSGVRKRLLARRRADRRKG